MFDTTLIDREKVEKKTEAFREQEAKRTIIKTPDPISEMKPKTRKIVEVLKKGGFGCSNEEVVSLVSAMVGKDLSLFMGGDDSKKPKTADLYPSGCVVVPLKNENHHDYPLGAPVLIMDEDESYAISPNGEKGNHLTERPLRTIGIDRVATAKEVVAFFAEAEKINAAK